MPSKRSNRKKKSTDLMKQIRSSSQILYPGLVKGTRVMLGQLGKTKIIKSVHNINNQELYKLKNKPAHFLYKLRDTATHDFPEVVRVILSPAVKLTRLTLKKAKAAAMRRRKSMKH